MQYIYQNVDMGITGINSVVDYVNNEKFCTLLSDEKKEFECIKEEASVLLDTYNQDLKEINPIVKMESNIMGKIAINKDDEISSVAKLMIEGTNKGIMAITEKINNYKIKNEKIEKLALKLKATLEHNIEDLKEYL